MQYPLIAQLAREFEKPICILDLETTGGAKNPVRGIVDFAYVTVDAKGEQREFATMLNPRMPIEWRASDIHGLYAKDVDHLDGFESVTAILMELYANCVISGYNSRSFDVSVIAENFDHHGHGLLKPALQLDVRDIWCGRNGTHLGKLGDIAKMFGVKIGTAHRAQGDVFTTVNLLEAMLKDYGVDYVVRNNFLLKHKEPTYYAPAPAPITARTTTQRSPYSAPAPIPAPKAKPCRLSKEDQAKITIREFLESNAVLVPADYAQLAADAGVPASTISYALSLLISSGDVTLAQIQDNAAQAQLRPHIAKIKANCQRAGLKEIRMYAETLLGAAVDYNQLRLALSTP